MMLMRRMELLKERYLDETGDWGSSLSSFLACCEAHCRTGWEARCWEAAHCTAGLPVLSLPSLPPAPTSSSSSMSSPSSTSTSSSMSTSTLTWEAQCTVGLAGPLSLCPVFQTTPASTSSSTSTLYSTWSCSSEVKNGIITMCWDGSHWLYL